MANDYSKTQTLFPLETCPQVSDEDFNLFHTIDRELYTHLILNLGQDPAESVKFMAFWIWLERESHNSKLIKRLLSLPSAVMNRVADETRVCLMCLESENFQAGGELTLLPLILNCPVSIRFLHVNRIAVMSNVTKIVSTVCTRAFRGIVERVRGQNFEIGESSREAERRMMYNPHVEAAFLSLHPGLIQVPAAPVVESAVGRLPVHVAGFPAVAQPQMLNNDLGEMVNRNVNREENADRNLSISIDDRTMFLTFSKGYPIAEDEVKDYFTRRFGDFIENLIFQEVGEEEQVLYARMVVKQAAVEVMGKIAGRDKAKYTINGKHVWARKYVKKSRSPPRGGRLGAA